MARFDIYKNLRDIGYFLDVQTDLVAGLNTRVIVPLLPSDRAPTPGRRLNPRFLIEGSEHVMVTQFLAAVPERDLATYCGDLSSHQDEITAALDMIFQGF